MKDDQFHSMQLWINLYSMNKKQKQPEYNEKGVRYMMCQCGEYISVGDTATGVI